MDRSSLCSQGVTQSEAGLGNGGLNQGGSGLPFKCSGIDQVRPSLGSQPQKPFETTNQFQLLSPEPEQKPLLRRRLQLQWLRRRLQLRPPLLLWRPPPQQRRPPLLMEWPSLQLWGPPLLRLRPPLLLRPLQRRPLLQQELELEQLQRKLELQLQRELEQEQELELQLQLLQLELQLLQWEPELLQREPELELLPQILLPQQPDPWLQHLQRELELELRELELELRELLPPPPPQLQQLLEQLLQQQAAAQFLLAQSRGGSKCKENLSSNTSSSQVDEINLIGSQNPKDKSKGQKKPESRVWEFFEKITDEDGTKRSKCKKCGFKYLRDSRGIGTSTLLRHVAKCSKRATHDVGLLEPKDQGPETIQEKKIIEARTPERPCVPQAHIRPAVQSRTTFSSPASGVLGTTPAAPTKRRRVAEMHTESDKSICSKPSAFRPTSHDSANKSAGNEADEGKSSTPPAATEEEVQAPRDLQLSLATTKSGPPEESGSVHKQFASAEELRSIGERKKALKITLNCILDGLLKGQVECLERCKNAVDVLLLTVGSAVDVKPLEAIFTELFASSKEWQSIQDPASLYQNEVLVRVAMLSRESDEARELLKEENSSFSTISEQMKRYEKKIFNHKQIISSALDEHKELDEDYEELELENEEQSSWIDGYRQMLLEIDKSLEHKKIIFGEAIDRHKGFEARAASKEDRLKTFVSRVEGILGVGLESAVPEVAAQKYAAHKREAMKAQLQDFSGKIKDFFEE